MSSTTIDSALMARLRSVLAGLYDARAARVVVVDAGLELARIDLNGDAVTVWFGILNEARKHERVGALVEVALREYPSHAGLRAVAEALVAAGATLAIAPEASVKVAEVAREEALFTWLHLSDVHVGHGDAGHGWDQALVLDALRRDIAQIVARGEMKPDAVFVTGDVAFSGGDRRRGPTEWEDAGTWLVAVAEAVGVGPERVFVAPGNHDVQRSADKDRAVARLVKLLRDGGETLDDALKDANDRAALAGRLARYLDFVSMFAPGCLGEKAAPEKRLWWTHRETSRGLKLRLIGLNTALLCADDKDHGKLCVGKEQLSSVLLNPAVEDDELVVVMSHHPFTGGWLADETNVRQWMRSRAHVHLSGHVHEADAEQARSGAGGSFVSVVAGSAHGEKGPAEVPAGHGYSFASVRRVKDGELVLRVVPRKWAERSKAFRVDADNVPDGETYADLPLRGP